jgi:membrane fusion protein, multidrug efflux system
MKQSLIVLTILALPNWVLAETANPASENLSDTNIPLRAQIKAKDSTQISSEMSARIHQLKWRDGDHFNEGDTLVSFHCSLEEAQLNKAKATLEKAVKTYEVKQRLEQLHSIGALELAVAKAEEGEAKADVQIAQAVLSRCVIKAPFSGKVTDVTAKPYQTVKAGDSLLEILNDKVLEIEFMAPSKNLPNLNIGKHFQVTINETNKSYQAEITRLGGKVDPVSQTIKVYGRIINKADDLLPGMSGAVDLTTKP